MVEGTVYQECSLVLESVNASRYSVVSQFEMLALHSPRVGTGAHNLIQPLHGFQCFRRSAELPGGIVPPRPIVAIASATPMGTSAPAVGTGTWPTEPFVISHKRAPVDIVSQRSP